MSRRISGMFHDESDRKWIFFQDAVAGQILAEETSRDTCTAVNFRLASNSRIVEFQFSYIDIGCVLNNCMKWNVLKQIIKSSPNEPLLFAEC